MSIFSVQLSPQQHDVDLNGHVNYLVYFSWAEHVRQEFVRHAGITPEDFAANEVGPVILEARARYLSELRLGEGVTVTCEPSYGPGKTFTWRHRFLRDDRSVAAEFSVLMGMLDHATRRLVARPRDVLRSLATRPDLLEPVGPAVVCESG